MTFDKLNLIDPIRKALQEEGYEKPTPIQAQAIPGILEQRDLLGCAQTGTGKTAAFAIPILQLLHNKPSDKGARRIRSLILTPTRELAIQIGESFTAYGRHTGIRNLVIFGGVSQVPQVDEIRRGTEVLVATPGRLLDLMNQGLLSLKDIELFVLDEADRMLDMGFIHDVKKVIAKLPAERQTLLFSATMPEEIAKLADSILRDPLKVAVTPVSSTVEIIEQSVFFVEKHDKRHLLAHLLQDPAIVSALVFTRTKHGANRVAGDLGKVGVKAEAIHGNKSQNARQSALNNFKNARTRVLVATDIAARGIDLEELSHVINFDLPNVPETYVHRIGRTGRAGASGIALSFCDTEEREYLRDIQKLIGKRVPVMEEHPWVVPSPAPIPSAPQPRQGGRFGQQRSRPEPREEGGERQPRREPQQRQPRRDAQQQQTRQEEPKPQRHGQDAEGQRHTRPQATGGTQQPARNEGRRPQQGERRPQSEQPQQNANRRQGQQAQQGGRQEKDGNRQERQGNNAPKPQQPQKNEGRRNERRPSSGQKSPDSDKAFNTILTHGGDTGKKGFTILTEPSDFRTKKPQRNKSWKTKQ